MADRRARSRRGSRSASSPMSDLPDAEYEELANFHSKHELFDAIERGHSITLAAGAREKVAVTLLRYAERCFRRERRIAHEVESRLKTIETPIGTPNDAASWMCSQSSKRRVCSVTGSLVFSINFGLSEAASNRFGHG